MLSIWTVPLWNYKRQNPVRFQIMIFFSCKRVNIISQLIEKVGRGWVGVGGGGGRDIERGCMYFVHVKFVCVYVCVSTVIIV